MKGMPTVASEYFVRAIKEKALIFLSYKIDVNVKYDCDDHFFFHFLQ